MNKLSFYKVVSQGGLDTSENHLLLEDTLPGGAHRLVNYEVGLYGGYRRINGYEYYDTNYPTVDDTNAEGKILGLFVYRAISGTETIYAARKQKSGNTYGWYSYNSGTGWTSVATGLTLNTTGSRNIVKIRHVKFTWQNESYAAFTDGVNNAYVFDGTDWFQLDPSGAGTTGDPGGDQLLAAPLYCSVFENHLFLSGDYSYPGIVCHSAPTNPIDFTVASGGGQLLTGYTVKQIKPFRENLFIFGNANIKKIYVDGTDFVIKDVTGNIGTIASDSVLEINGDVIFLAQDGIRTISGTDKIGDINLTSISKQIQLDINSLQENYDLRFLNATVIKKKSQFRYYINEDNSTDTGAGIIGGLRTTNGQTGWEFFTLSGIRTSVVENDYIADVETILHGDYDGSIFKQESGRTFNGTPITSIYSTPFLSLGDPITRKLIRKVHTFLRPEGNATINMSLTFDWFSADVHNPNTYASSTENTFNLYDDPDTLYDSAVYDIGTELNPVVTTNVEGSWKSFKITYTTSGDYEPHTIQGFIIEITPQGNT